MGIVLIVTSYIFKGKTNINKPKQIYLKKKKNTMK